MQLISNSLAARPRTSHRHREGWSPDVESGVHAI